MVSFLCFFFQLLLYRFWSLKNQLQSHHLIDKAGSSGCYLVVSISRTIARKQKLWFCDWYLGSRLYFCRSILSSFQSCKWIVVEFNSSISWWRGETEVRSRSISSMFFFSINKVSSLNNANRSFLFLECLQSQNGQISLLFPITLPCWNCHQRTSYQHDHSCINTWRFPKQGII